jgi:hypothetical protein
LHPPSATVADDGLFEHLIVHDLVTVAHSDPHASGAQVGGSDRSLGADGVQVVVRDETRVPVLDAVHHAEAVHLKSGQ